jgi:hypothetical protein
MIHDLLRRAWRATVAGSDLFEKIERGASLPAVQPINVKEAHPSTSTPGL